VGFSNPREIRRQQWLWQATNVQPQQSRKPGPWPLQHGRIETMFSTTSNEKNQRIVLSAMDERIKVLNNKKNEICIMDNHLFKRLLTKVLV